MSDEKKPAKKELPWGLPAFIFFMCLAVGFGVAFMMQQLFGVKNAIDWAVTMMFRLIGPILILAIAIALIRSQSKPKEEHH